MTDQSRTGSFQNSHAKGFKHILLCLLLIQLGVVLPLLSWAGLPPIDEGFQLAYSRRILNGEVPHRDFISIRPVLTPLLHTIDLLWSDDHALRVSRTIVLIEYALIAYFGMRLVARNLLFSFQELLMISILGLLLIMDYRFFGIVWYTIDGLFISVAGLCLIQSNCRCTCLAGYFLLGLSPLAKQNFGIVPVAALFMAKPGRRIESILAVGLGPALYLGAMLWFGALQDFLDQIGSQSQVSYLIRTGCRPTIAIASIISGMVSAQFVIKPPFRPRVQQSLIFLIAFAFITLPLAYSQLSFSKSWISFYFLIGWFLRSGVSRYGFRVVSLVVPMILAWASSVSFFLNNVAYFGIWLFATGCFVIFNSSVESDRLRPRFIALSLLTVGLVFTYIRTNLHTVSFKEPSIFQINQPLKGIFPGATGIYTSQANELIYKDIAQAVALLEAQSLESVVLPGLPSWNVLNKQKNPVAMDWPFSMELGSEQLQRRYASSVINCKTTHGLIFFTEPFLDGSEYKDYNRMWDDIRKEFPHETKVGSVRVFTLRPLDVVVNPNRL